MPIAFDRLFGTFAEEHDAACRYGLTVPLVSNNPVKIAFHEWLKLLNDLYDARSLREAAFYLFGPPGWRPQEAGDGARITFTNPELRAIALEAARAGGEAHQRAFGDRADQSRVALDQRQDRLGGSSRRSACDRARRAARNSGGSLCRHRAGRGPAPRRGPDRARSSR